MRKYEKVEKVYIGEKLIETTCDICGSIAKEGGWGSSTYDVEDTEITVIVKQKDGEECPEGGSGTEYNVDLCPKCFKEKLIPFLESQGCKAVRKDWNW